jgi:cell pole-organizing protein PopZ
MNAAPPNPAPPESGGDPSMEDILASIRRILNEEEPKPAPDVLELTPAMRTDAPPVAMPEPAAPVPVAGAAAITHPTPIPAQVPAPAPIIASPPPPPAAEPPPLMAPTPLMAPEPEPMPVLSPSLRDDPAPVPEPPPLVAPAAAAAAAASVGELVRRLGATQHVAVTRGGPTIEDLVREEIRGLLKAWLDENLPRVVERLVRAEIERVVGRQVG